MILDDVDDGEFVLPNGDVRCPHLCGSFISRADKVCPGCEQPLEDGRLPRSTKSTKSASPPQVAINSNVSKLLKNQKLSSFFVSVNGGEVPAGHSLLGRPQQNPTLDLSASKNKRNAEMITNELEEESVVKKKRKNLSSVYTNMQVTTKPTEKKPRGYKKGIFF